MAGFTISKGLPGIGANFGAGLGEGIEALAKHKLGLVLDRQARKKDEQELERAGYTPEYSRLVANQPKEHQYKYLIDSPEGSTQQPQFTQDQVQRNRTAEAQALAVTPQEQQAVGLQDIMQSLNPRNQSQQSLGRLTGGTGQNLLQSLLQGQGGQQQNAQQISAQQSQNPLLAQAQQQRNIPAQTEAPRRITPAQALSARRGNANLSGKEQLEINKEQRKASHALEKEVKESYKSYRETDAKLKQLDKLVDSGKLNSPLWADLVEGVSIPHVGRIGLPTSALSKESQLFETTATDLALKSAKSVFGSRMTGGEVALLQSTKPSLSNSNEVKKQVINNIRILNEASKVKHDSLVAIKEANGGTYPHDLDEWLEKVAGPKLDELHDEFIRGASKNKTVSERPAADSKEAFWGDGQPIKFKKGGKSWQSNGKEYVEVA